jgi:hypothetical protein
VAAAARILSVSAKGKTAEDLLARGIADVKSEFNWRFLLFCLMQTPRHPQMALLSVHNGGVRPRAL